MRPFAAILSLLIGAAGWYYLFYSRAAHNLAMLEEQRLNDWRILFRRIGGAIMLALAVCLALLFWRLETRAAPVYLLLVLVLLVLIVVLALVDLRLTWRIRVSHRRLMDQEVPRRRDL